MLRLLRHPRVGLLSVGHCLVGLLLCFATGPARSQPVPLKEELTAQKRQKLEQQAAALARQGDQRYQEGRLDDAVQLGARVLEIRRRVYPPDRFPDGHPNLAVSLNNLGGLLLARGEPAWAEPLYRDALATYQRLVSALLAGSAEAEALNFLAQLPLTRDAYLSVTRELPDKTDSAYHALWHAKGAVTQMLQQRRLTLLAAKDQTTRDLAQQLTATRQALASLLRAPVPPPAPSASANSAT